MESLYARSSSHLNLLENNENSQQLLQNERMSHRKQSLPKRKVQDVNNTVLPVMTNRTPVVVDLTAGSQRPRGSVLEDIKSLQKSTKLIINRTAFSLLVREVQLIVNRVQFRWTDEAIGALQEAAEAHLTSLFNESYRFALHAGRITLMPRDLQLAVENKQGGAV